MKAIKKNVSETLERELSMAKYNMEASKNKILELESRLSQNIIPFFSDLHPNRLHYSFKDVVRRLHKEIECYETSRRKYEDYKEIKTELDNN